MQKLWPIVWRSLFIISSMNIMMTYPIKCLAETNVTPSPEFCNILPESATNENNTVNLRLKQMQEQLDAYKQTMLHMQDTINTLKMQISTTYYVPLTHNTGQNTPSNIPAINDSPIHLSNDSSIGDNLIFGSENLAGKPSLVSSDLTDKEARIFQNFNPDISFTGDFIGSYADRTQLLERNRFILREAEIGFSAAIDPYTRGTFIVALPYEESPEIEEGYLTFTALPFGLLGKAGKFKNSFGKINTLHTHELPQVDRPAVYEHFFGEEGLTETGISLNKLVPFPWYSALTLEISNGDTLPLFGHGRLTKPLTVGHLKNFFELSNTKTLEVGISGAFGARGINDFGRISSVEGIDITFRWLPPAQHHTFIWQSELLAAQQEDPVIGKSSLFGGYSYMEYKFNNRWSGGVRLDYSQVPLIGQASEIAVAPYIDYWQSEFARLRLEYKHTFGKNMESSNRLWAQYSIIMGPHAPHLY